MYGFAENQRQYFCIWQNVVSFVLDELTAGKQINFCNTIFWKMFIPEMIDRELAVFIFLEDLVNDNEKKKNNPLPNIFMIFT